MESEILIEVTALSRFYGRQRAIEDVNFNVHRGEILGFLGPNGAGKSTTMQIISGIVAANHGSVTIAGHNINETPRQAKQHIGFLPEQPPLYTDLTVDEFLRYAGRLRGLKGEKLNAAIEKSKSCCGQEDSGSRLIANLSKGYKQRVGIAQAIIHAPDVIILDEPTSGLDPIQIREIRDLMRELARDHSVILSTHILSEVQGLCHRVLIINQGKIVLNQSLQSLRGDDETPNSAVIAMHKPPLPEGLLSIEGVLSVESISENTFQVNFETDKDATDAIVARAAKDAWGLYKLNPDDNSLETMFMRLTQGEPEAINPSGDSSE